MFKSLRWSSFKRLLASIADVTWVLVPTVIICFTQFIIAKYSSLANSSDIRSSSMTALLYNFFANLYTTNRIEYYFIFFLFLIIILVVIMQVSFVFNRRTHDPELVLKYQKMWDDMKHDRKLAAKTILENKAHLSDIKHHQKRLEKIDPVIDVLDDLGFYESGGQLSAEVIHHHFYPWLSGYYESTKDYTKEQMKTHGWWGYIEEIFKKTAEIEEKKTRRKIEPKFLSSSGDLNDFLEEERDLSIEPITITTDRAHRKNLQKTN